MLEATERLPASRAALFALGALYAVQYLPMIFFVVVLPVILREHGFSVAAIATMQIAFLPYVIKFLWAPLLDRYSPGRQHYKSWITLLSFCHIGFLLVLGMVNPGGSQTVLFALLLCITLTVSTQDIAIDALAVNVLAPSQRGIGNGVQAAGGYFGGAIGAGVFLSVYEFSGWQAAVFIQAGIFAIPLFMLRVLDEVPNTLSERPSLRHAFGFFKQPGTKSWTALLTTFRLPLMATILPIQVGMVDQGMTPSQIGVWMGLVALSTAMIASLVGGVLVSRWNRYRAFLTFGIFNLCILTGLCALMAFAPEDLRFGLVMVWVAAGFSDVILYAGSMDRARPRMPGFDFSIQVGLIFMVQTLTEPLWGHLTDVWGLLAMFIVATGLGILPVVLLTFMRGLRTQPTSSQAELRAS